MLLYRKPLLCTLHLLHACYVEWRWGGPNATCQRILACTTACHFWFAWRFPQLAGSTHRAPQMWGWMPRAQLFKIAFFFCKISVLSKKGTTQYRVIHGKFYCTKKPWPKCPYSFYPLSADYKLLKYQQHICCPEGRIIDLDIMISILALMEISNHLIGVVSHVSNYSENLQSK